MANIGKEKFKAEKEKYERIKKCADRLKEVVDDLCESSIRIAALDAMNPDNCVTVLRNRTYNEEDPLPDVAVGSIADPDKARKLIENGIHHHWHHAKAHRNQALSIIKDIQEIL